MNALFHHQGVKIAFVLALVLVFLFVLIGQSYASVTAISIIVPVVVAAMGSFGIGTLVTGMSASQISDWVSSELSSWASSMSDTVENLINVSGISVTTVGSLRLLPSVAYKVILFVKWLANKYSVVSGGSPVLVSGGTFSDQPIPFYGSGSYQAKYENGLVIADGYGYSLSISNYNSDLTEYVFAYGSGATANIVVCSTSGNVFYQLIEKTPTNTYNNRGSFGGSSVAHTLTYPDVWYKETSVQNWALAVYLCPTYQTLDDGLYAVQSLIDGTSARMSLVPAADVSYPDYLGDDEEETPYLIDYGGTPGLTLDEAADDIMEKVVSNDLAVDGEVVTPVPDEWPDVTSPVQVPGLPDIFPFCIPFDIYRFFNAFVAPPEAPRFEVPFVIPGIVNYTFVVDLSAFDEVASLVRQMELLAFCIGLALVTRSQMIRG